MYFHLLSVTFCAAVSTFPTGQDEAVHPSIETLDNGVKILKLRALEEDIELRLHPAGKVISDDFTEFEAGIPSPNSANINDFKRKLYRNAESNTALRIDEDGPLSIYGRINSKLWIEPYKSKKINHGNIVHRLLRIPSKKSYYFKDSIIHSDLGSYEGQKIMSNSNEKHVEIKYMFVTDSSMEDEEEKDVTLKDKLTQIMLETENIFELAGFNFTFTMLGFDRFNKDSEPDYIKNSFFPGDKNLFNYVTLMKNMGKYYSDDIKMGKWDMPDRSSVIFLITKRVLGYLNDDGSIFNGTLGAAGTVGGVCDPNNKHAVSVYFPRDMNGDTVAHETAHLLGSPHDGEGPVRDISGSPGSKACPGDWGFQMGDAFPPNKYKFSPCTIENINNFLTLPFAHCLF